MKKILTIAALGLALSSVSTFAQGYFLFTANASTVWTLWNGATPVRQATNYVAFLYGSGTPLVANVMSAVPTNNSTAYSYSTAWTDILSDPSFKLATNSSSSTLASVLCSTPGGISYNGAASFPVAGTSSTGGNTTVYVIGWDAHYTTPDAAQTAGAAVGWSSPFAYTYTSSIGTPSGFTASGIVPFGVGAVPEPSTFALAGLGAAALMIFRRKK